MATNALPSSNTSIIDIPGRTFEYYTPVALQGLQPEAQLRALRLNCLGSLYFFVKVGLRRRRLTDNLHLPMCLTLEREHIKDVYEMPRDHFKSTICSEGKPIWNALPFTNQDEDEFSALGYSKAFVRWMKKCHSPDTRILLISENITNSAKLGRRVRWHYESNATFRNLFPEVLPDTSCKWTDFSLTIKRTTQGTGGGHGEGTFDFLGVGGALQSRHYTGGIVQDDLVGKKALESATIMDKTIEFHRLVIGAFEDEDKNHEGDELVVGNRWAFNDLNSWIRENEDWFRFTTHSALGGCCPLHPQDTPIFPEEFSENKLLRIKSRLGSYLYSCQFLNNPVAPEDADFKEEYLNYYRSWQAPDGQWYIQHEAKNGFVKKDCNVRSLEMVMTVDPAHAGNQGRGRCRHAIVVTGQDDIGDMYLLHTWAQASNYDTFFDKIYETAKRWRIHKVGFETVAAQKFAAYHIQFRNLTQDWKIRIVPLKGEVEGPDGEVTRKKTWRIRTALGPIFESERFWVQRKHQDFIGEYSTFPRGRFVDQLDALAYAPQLLRMPVSEEQNMSLLAANQARARLVNQPYSHRVN